MHVVVWLLGHTLGLLCFWPCADDARSEVNRLQVSHCSFMGVIRLANGRTNSAWAGLQCELPNTQRHAEDNIGAPPDAQRTLPHTGRVR